MHPTRDRHCEKPDKFTILVAVCILDLVPIFAFFSKLLSQFTVSQKKRRGIAIAKMKIMKITFAINRGFKLFVPILLLLLSLCIQEARAGDTNLNRGQFSAADYKFAVAAATGGMMEVALGQMASQKALSPGVKQFGNKMVADHGQAGEKLKQIFAAQNATWPSGLTAHQQREVDRLNELQGKDFDKDYISLMVKDHKQDLKEFQKAAHEVSNPDLRQFASDTSSLVEQHLQMAKSLAEVEKEK